MRTCKVFKNEKIDGKWQRVFESEAVFHQFSTDHEEFEMGPGPYPVAIVEFPDGSLASRPVELIRFNEPTHTLPA